MWREFFYFLGPCTETAAAATAAATASSAARPVGGSNNSHAHNHHGGPATKEDNLSHPETTHSYGTSLSGSTASSTTNLSGSLTSNLNSKTDLKNVDVEATKKFARLLRKDERVTAAGQVMKHDLPTPRVGAQSAAAVTKQRRILVLTDAPRLLFLDPVGNIVRGNLELGGDAVVEVKMVRLQN